MVITAHYITDDFKLKKKIISFKEVKYPHTDFAIDTYFEEDYVEDNENFDILGWWKRHAEKFPVLSTMARDFLAIPLSTVSSESTFSLGGQILGEARSSLTPEILEALVCSKDWLYKEKVMNDQGEDPTEDQSTVTSSLLDPSGTNLPLTGQGPSQDSALM